ncbi:DNA-directed RNA polymerase subunit alpha [Mycoplasmopsis citelli]|uniref:DNA-directed RNA polymerase subunit alpha n=1 Tax=Mycoplasmopsis citelli TaxID=171281 RepID=A0A449B366_9BACT|nr:DNA-directed RNA polymerase subunit alpha [Mycoplasmopsis citelli]UUD36377.1 DNA-directed RNA polymerase subunit alpha [Mycoplasmopsis citelli]VEU75039.1 DNA-directed RNA polymerase, alpha subunit [Mycoplasmopsis citelli]
MEKMTKLDYLQKTENNNNDFNLTVQLKPLERGFGNTLGVALRRVLLSNITSLAPFAVKIEGVEHEFQTLKDVVEDVPTILMNIRKARFSFNPETLGMDEILKAELVIKAPGKIKANSLQVVSHPNIQVVDPAVEIATIQSEKALRLEVFMRQGRGFMSFEENKILISKVEDKIQSNIKKGKLIAVDSNFSPVENVNYSVKELNSASPQIEEELQLNLKTDGTIKPKQALKQAAEILIGHFSRIGEVDSMKVDIFKEEIIEEGVESPEIEINQINLSVRSLNALRRIKKTKLSEIARMTYEELEQVKNLGSKSLNEIIEKLHEYGFKLKEGDE